ncbi:MAG TPA: ferrous iron transport protein B [Candidatus Krumholzibacteria bacterium]|nr:ferrous iron transport protein B [Candidatus Krumholzibacteria bacterium]HRX50599.1 ferrous iron transport protein B [Candidatus Krumholzibacteria bacterium]
MARDDARPNPTVLLMGNPNSGKTSLFNALTGSRQRVGNYPGVTVEKREGHWIHQGRIVTVRDLPGTYSLSSYSPEEAVASEELLAGDHDAVVVVADATVLRRSLMFLLQVMRLDKPVVFCLNMADEARRAGQQVDKVELARLLGVPVVETAAHRGEGVAELKAAVAAAPTRRALPPAPEIRELIAGLPAVEPVRDDVDASTRRLQAFGRAADLLMERTVLAAPREDHRRLSQRIDRVVAHKVWGMPIFLAVMYAVFWLTFTLGEAPMGWIEAGVARLGDGVTALWPGSPESPLLSLLVDGIIAGVGGVLVFLPNIVLLFLGLSILEDTGYMARAAYIMDRVLSRVGLHGKSFLPLVTGFGCSIPGIMATRTIENERDRLATILVLPLMSCGARLPIWLLIIPALFPPAWRTPALWGVYLAGIVLAMGLSLLLRGTLLKGEPTPFMLELPPYRMPTLRSLVMRMWDRSRQYLRKAGTVILAISVVLWVLTTFPRPDAYEVDAELAAGAAYTAEQAAGIRAAEDLEASVVGRLGRWLEPAFRPLGFDWRLVTASLGAFAAKEVFVSQMSIVYALGEDGDPGELGARLGNHYSSRVGVSMILFLLVGTPCMATVAVTRRETGGWTWALLQFGGLTVLAYLLAWLAYAAGGWLS